MLVRRFSPIIKRADAQSLHLASMGRNRGRRSAGPRNSERRPSVRVGWPVAVCIAAIVVLLIGLLASIIVQQGQKRVVDRRLDSVGRGISSQTQPQSDVGYTDAQINAAANYLFSAVNPLLPENEYFTPFAKEKILWISNERKLGKLSIILLKNVAGSGLDFEDLMASGRPEGKPVIVIARPRFLDLLAEGGGTSAPFNQQQGNDFALGLVHEVVHLQNANPVNAANLEDRLQEELRTWREVDVNVVRQFRRLNQPMNAVFIEADDALRSCRDRLPCKALRTMLLPGEKRR
jgi:hypothetical protein